MQCTALSKVIGATYNYSLYVWHLCWAVAYCDPEVPTSLFILYTHIMQRSLKIMQL